MKKHKWKKIKGSLIKREKKKGYIGFEACNCGCGQFRAVESDKK